MNQWEADKMATLCYFLKTQVEEKNWDYSRYIRAKSREEAKTLAYVECGTTACAAGYLPVIFPKNWHYIKYSFESISIESRTFPRGAYNIFNALAHFFGITFAEAKLLFGGYLDEDLKKVTRAEFIRRAKKLALNYGYKI